MIYFFFCLDTKETKNQAEFTLLQTSFVSLKGSKLASLKQRAFLNATLHLFA